MILHFDIKCADHKKIDVAIEETLGGKAKYFGVPSYAYEIGNYTVDKNGKLEFRDFDDIDEAAQVVDACVMATEITPTEGKKTMMPKEKSTQWQ